MIISTENLEAGIEAWQEYNWGPDFVNDDYHEIYDARDKGIDTDWCEHTVRRLWDWRAIRSPKGPNSISKITARLKPILSSVKEECDRLKALSGVEPTITALSWEDVAGLYELVLPIKCYSYMFASKFCHFLFPKAFMVIDNEATGIVEYEFYWRGMKDEWNRYLGKEEARQRLISSIRPKKDMHHEYPYETKIIELCQIGFWKNRRSILREAYAEKTD